MLREWPWPVRGAGRAMDSLRLRQIGSCVFCVGKPFLEDGNPADDYNACAADQSREEQDFDDLDGNVHK